MPIENWRPVDGFPGYSVNSLGQIRKDDSKRVLVPRYNQYNIPFVGLMKLKGDSYKQYVRSLPRLVAQAFLPQPNSIFDTPIQLNGDRSDCSVDNLTWRPRWYAVLYNRQFEIRYPNPIDVPVRPDNENKEFPDSFAAACTYGLLEREVVLSILNHTPAWPTYQQFELVV